MTSSPAPRVVTFGETMALLRSPAVGPLAHSSSLSLGVGGAESNVAIGLARAGVPTVWMGRVGRDPFGELVTREIRAEGVHVHAVVDDVAATGLMVKEQRTSVQTRVMYYRNGSAGSRLSPADLPVEAITEAKVLHVSGITPALSQSAREAVEAAIGLARNSDTLVSFDVNYRSALWSVEEASLTLRPLIAYSDLVFASEEEVPLLTDISGGPAEQARAISAIGPTHVVIKRGARGAVALVEGQLHESDAFEITPVDTVGAGDAFVAGYLAGFLARSSTPEVLRRANAAGAYACMSGGDWEGLPRGEEWRTIGDHGTDPVTR
ncbi:MAG: sugar kinase [Mycetocola sp.]|jgi:2-dehydro-3-deoxygluconokinase|nr:sugar kinase [Mycetocola sp.]